MIKVEIKGLQIAFNVNNKYSSDTTKKVKELVKKHTYRLKELEQEIVPVDTGFLRSTITARVHKNGMFGMVTPRTAYDSYVEYGTRYQYAQPYVRPSFEITKDEFLADIEKVIKK